MEAFLPARFAASVNQHLLLNYVAHPDQPLILGIFGRSGEGKTYQLRRVLNNAAIVGRSINAADLESDRAGQPGKLVLAAYVEAARMIESGSPAALIIDDIDTTIGEWLQNTGTVNHQQVLAQLMHLADHPESIERIGVVRRVPIFVTGNDPAKIYPPLRRVGRMEHMHWQPTSAERIAIAGAIFADSLSGHHVDEIVSLYDEHPIAFFAQVNSATRRRLAMSVLGKMANDTAAVVSSPDRYLFFIKAALSSNREDFLDVLREEAAALDESIRSGEKSYL